MTAGGRPSGQAPHRSWSRQMVVVNAILTFAIVIVILQLWLLTATMNAYLGGNTAIVVPSALASSVCLLLNAGLLRYLYRLER